MLTYVICLNTNSDTISRNILDNFYGAFGQKLRASTCQQVRNTLAEVNFFYTAEEVKNRLQEIFPSNVVVICDDDEKVEFTNLGKEMDFFSFQALSIEITMHQGESGIFYSHNFVNSVNLGNLLEKRYNCPVAAKIMSYNKYPINF
jgi:hypothetical protein